MRKCQQPLSITQHIAKTIYRPGIGKLIRPISRLLFNHMNEGIVIYHTDGQLVMSNHVAEKYGFLATAAAKDSIYPLYFKINGAIPLPSDQQPLNRLLQGEQDIVQELWLKPGEGKAGSIVRIVGKALRSFRGMPLGFMLVVHDITLSKWHEKRLEVSEQRFKSLFEHNPDIVLWFDLKGTLLSVNSAFETVTGHCASELIGHSVGELINDVEAWQLQQLLEKVHEGRTIHQETSITNKTGELVYLHATVIPIIVEEQLAGFYIVAQNVTAQKQSMETISRIAYFDSLTGLPNRHSFFETLTATLAQCSTCIDRQFAVLFVDLDRFKLINDTLGHRAGDFLLEQTALRMGKCVGDSGTIARLSGDEFIILLNHAGAQEAEQLAGRILDEIAVPIIYDNNRLLSTASIGISLYPDHGTSSEQLIQFADIAMYRVKEQGKNNYLFFTSEMNESIVRRTTMEKQLAIALEQEQLTLFYQPQVEASTGKISGFEALVRWNMPERGLISPLEFIPLAEETGMIIQLGEWVLRRACEQQKRWIDEGLMPVTIAVNISMKQFEDDSLFETIRHILFETKLPPHLLELEITESIGLQGADQVINKLNRLKTLGVSIAIDDFGTGYSSLHYLQKLPIDTLKIDKSFIRDMINVTPDISIVHSIIRLAHSLQLDVLAEGVEVVSQLEMLAELKCERLQGYLFSRPIPADEARVLLQRQKLDEHYR